MRRVLLVVWLAACGDNLRVVPFDEYDAEELAARCRFWVRCGLVGDEALCAQFSQPRVDPSVAAAVDAGIIKWDSERAQLCIDWYDSLDCNRTTELYRYAPCFPLYLGTKLDGDACAFGYECISRECWLEGSQCNEACCIGYCTGDAPPIPGGIGDRCRYAPCREGFCDDSLCVPLRAEGEVCVVSDQCEIGLSCETGMCRVLPAPGAPCTDACRDVGQRCNGLTGLCERVLLQGEQCFVDDECSPVYECSRNKYTCQLIGGGGSCGLSKQGSCGLPYVCDYMTNRCTEPKPDGAACSYGVECASYSCDFRARACTSEVCI